MRPEYFKARRRFECAGDSRFLTFSCYHHLSLFTNDPIKNKFVEVLDWARDRCGFSLYAWVIMPNHIHLLLQPALPGQPVPAVLKLLKGSFSNAVLRRWRQLEAPILPRIRDSRGKLHFWQRGGGYDRNIESVEEFLEKLDYIHNNPVVAGLVACATDWLWSSARWYTGAEREVLLPMDPLPI